MIYIYFKELNERLVIIITNIYESYSSIQEAKTGGWRTAFLHEQ